MSDLKAKHCKACEGGVETLSHDEAQRLLEQLQGWEISENGKEIYRACRFKNYYQTIAFVNAVAWIANQEDHHPDLEVGYSRCLVRYSTHAIDGLSENDFICAAKIDALLAD
jgi:4a-hydroxytetrahydrobiopterin dehydratase